MKSKLKTPWGYEGIMISSDLYSLRMFIINQGERTPYIYHKKQDKTIYILQGVVNIIIEGRQKLLNEGDRYHIQPKIMHRFHAIKGDTTILEVGTKIEDDIVVVEDDYKTIG